MGRTVCGEDERVCAWMDGVLGLREPSPVRSAIGYEIDGMLVAAVCFDDFTGTSVQAHIVARCVVPPGLLAAAAHYAYRQLGVLRMTFMTPESNHRAIEFVTEMGAEYEGRMRRATPTGDMLIHALWKDAPFAQRMLALAGA